MTQEHTAEEIVKALAEWSNEYPRSKTYSFNQEAELHKELNAIEEMAKAYESPIKEESQDVDEYNFLNQSTINELCDVLQNACQLLGGIKPDAVNENWWSDWDESVLASLINMLKKVQPHYKIHP